MRLTDFSPSFQLILFGLLAVALALPLIRLLVFIYREKVGVPTTYPKNWSVAQCRALAWFRLLVGLGLFLVWGSFLFIVHWPFKFWDLFYFIVLLLITSLWIRLLDRRNWGRSRAKPRSFLSTITFLMIWWGVVFTATGWMLAPSILAKLSNHTGLQTPLAASSNSLLEGKAAYGDWRADAPGVRRYITPSDLPAPYASSSVENVVSVIAKPAAAKLNVPSGFTVKLSLLRVEPGKFGC